MTHTVRLHNEGSRVRACQLVAQAPEGHVMRIEQPKRTLDQNNKMWAMLTDISMQHMLGRKYTPEQWKCVFMNACGWEVQFLEGLDNTPFPAGFRSSQLSKKQMIDLIEFIQAEGDRNGIRWSDEAKEAA